METLDENRDKHTHTRSQVIQSPNTQKQIGCEEEQLKISQLMLSQQVSRLWHKRLFLIWWRRQKNWSSHQIKVRDEQKSIHHKFTRYRWEQFSPTDGVKANPNKHVCAQRHAVGSGFSISGEKFSR